MSNFCDRLKEERKRLKLNQEEFAALGGVKKGAQFNYENGSRAPDTDYLFAVAAAGVDLVFLLTGHPSPDSMSEDEQELLMSYRGLDVRGKARILGVMEGATPQDKSVSRTNISIGGDVGQQINGDIHGNVKAPRIEKKVRTQK